MNKISELSNEKIAKIEEIIVNWMIDETIPGANLSIVNKDKLLYTEAFGSRDLKTNTPTTIDTLFGIGSCTKSFAALSLMILASRGKIDINEPVDQYLPVSLGKDVTSHHLMTHSSGMPSLAVSELLIDRMIDMDERGAPMGSFEDFFRHMNGAKEELAADPGERFFYLNEGYTLIGFLVEKISGKSFDEFVKENILDPLDMKRSTFDISRSENDVMTPYFMGKDGPEPTPIPSREMGYAPGGLLSSAKEMANYLIMNMNGGTYNDKEIIDPRSLKRMHEEHIELNSRSYGYGWSIKDFSGKKFVGHGGSIAVSTAHVAFTPDFGVVLLCNTAGGTPLECVVKGILAELYGKDHKKLDYFVREERLNSVVGDYESYKGLKKAKVEREGTVLKLTFKERLESQSLILIPDKPTAEGYKFHYLSSEGVKQPVEYDNGDLYIERWRLHKVD